jgi:hypothetical protein
MTTRNRHVQRREADPLVERVRRLLREWKLAGQFPGLGRNGAARRTIRRPDVVVDPLSRRPPVAQDDLYRGRDWDRQQGTDHA